MFSSFANRNFRIFFIAQSFSVIGTFAQELAQAWLVLDLTHSPAQLGLVVGLQFAPMMLLGPIDGVLVDRFDRRHLLFFTQSMHAVLVFALWGLTVSGIVQPWMVYIFALLAGINGALNTPTRLGFLHELVGKDMLHNAVSLNSTVYSAGRVLGPALAGILITLFGVAPAFFINGVSFLGVIAALLLMDPAKLLIEPKAAREPGQFQAGLRYMAGTPVIASVMVMTWLVGIFTYAFPVSFPALARLTFHGNAFTLAVLTSSFGIGAVLGGLMGAKRGKADAQSLPRRAAMLGLTVLLAAIQPTLWLAAPAVVLIGYTMIRFSATANSVVQLTSRPDMRGRVLAMWTAGWVGSSAIGGPLIGFISEHSGPRWALALGGIAAVAVAGLGLAMMNHPAAGTDFHRDTGVY